MSKRSQQKLIKNGNRTLKFLREKAKLSMRKVGMMSGFNPSIINHLENGRLDIKPHHLKILLPIYGANLQIFQLFESGASPLPQDMKTDCKALIDTMNEEQLKMIYPVVRSVTLNMTGAK